MRFGAHDVVAANADHVARTEERKFLVDRARVDADVHRHDGAFLCRAIRSPQRVGLEDGPADAFAQPGAERVFADGKAHAASSR